MLSSLVERSVPLKQELWDFALDSRFHDQYASYLNERAPRDEATFIAVVETFFMEHRTLYGLTLIDHFVAANPQLSAEEQSFLLGWKDVVNGYFEVEEVAEEILVGATKLADNAQ